MAKANSIVGIECNGPATLAMAEVLKFRLDEMCSMRKRALDFKDLEGVHDMRVSSRRIRSALRDFLPYLKSRKMIAPTREIKKVADALGHVRDHDVAILALQKWSDSGPPNVAAGIQSLITVRETSRNVFRKELMAVLNQRALLELKSTFAQALETSTNSSKNSKVITTLAYTELAKALILQRLKELDELSSSLFEPLKTKPLHRMRIAAKRLRYALELFAPCWGDSLGAFSRQVAQMQTNLGDIHDSDVWVEYIGDRLANQLKNPNQEEEKAAMFWLLGQISHSRSKHFRSLLPRWQDWQAQVPNLLAALESVK